MCPYKNCLIEAFQMITHNIPFEDKTTLLNHIQYNHVRSYENNFLGLKLGTKDGGRINSLLTECHLLISLQTV